LIIIIPLLAWPPVAVAELWTLGDIMHPQNTYPSDKEQLLKSYFRRFLVFMDSCLAALMCVVGATGALLSYSRLFAISVPVALAALVVALSVFSGRLRSFRKRDGVEDAEWRAYLFRQPIILHAILHTFYICVVLLIAMFAVFKCIQYFYPGIVHVA
jgi:hypothetical protein